MTGTTYARRRLSRRLDLWDGEEPADALTCVAAVVGALERERTSAAGLDPDDVLAALTLLAPVQDALAAAEAALLTRARDSGRTWQELADALGAGSRQALQQRAARLGVGTEQPSGRPRRRRGAA